jgi:hypothetical protein
MYSLFTGSVSESSECCSLAASVRYGRLVVQNHSVQQRSRAKSKVRKTVFSLTVYNDSARLSTRVSNTQAAVGSSPSSSYQKRMSGSRPLPTAS